jgi:hypothetical protein
MAETTTTTLTEAIPTIVAAALLEFQEGNVVQPLVTNVDFPGPGVTHSTPFVAKLTAEATDALTSQALDSGSATEISPRSATVGVHAAYVDLRDIAALGAVSDMAAIAGQMIGQCLVVRRDLDLVTLFAALSTNQGGAATTTMAPADLYDAYGSLRTYFAPLPYNLVLHPGQIWATKQLVELFDNSADAIQSAGLGTVGEDWARNGFAGRAMGFDIYADANITFDTANGSGAAFSRTAFKNVIKRGFQIEIQRAAQTVSDLIVGSEIRGETVLRQLNGNEMQFCKWL